MNEFCVIFISYKSKKISWLKSYLDYDKDI